MPLKANAAFAGLQQAPDGQVFAVIYCTAADNRKLNKGVPCGHAAYLRFGWYWWEGTRRPATAAGNHGPFTSSRLAYQDAMAQHGKKRA